MACWHRVYAADCASQRAPSASLLNVPQPASCSICAVLLCSQRQKQKAFEQANGKQPLTWAQKQHKWIQTNAPCLAVCDICDVPPGGSSTRGIPNVSIAIGGRRRPGLLNWMRRSSPQHATKEAVRPSQPSHILCASLASVVVHTGGMRSYTAPRSPSLHTVASSVGTRI